MVSIRAHVYGCRDHIIEASETIHIGKLSVPSISKEFLDLGNFDTTTSATSVTGTNTVHINYGRYI